MTPYESESQISNKRNIKYKDKVVIRDTAVI